MNIFAGADNIISPLGFNTDENINALKENRIGLSVEARPDLTPYELPLSTINTGLIEETFNRLKNITATSDNHLFTRLEKLHLISIADAINQLNGKPDPLETVLILSTTKGNIDLLENSKKNIFPKERLLLSEFAKILNQSIGLQNNPALISNACISGVLGIIVGTRLIRSGKADTVIITGGDIISEFVISGFHSFQSLSPEPCKPFDKYRDGLSLGEGVGTIILSSNKNIFKDSKFVKVLGGASSNDANHISGPSRTGEGLYLAIQRALKVSGFPATEIDFISAHGTATDYNDEMESKAFSRSGFLNVPVNSYKGYIGHTLGAAGIIESIFSIHSMLENLLHKTAGYNELGVSNDINIIDEFKTMEINRCLKTASGFGGSNAAVIFEKT